jgi:hypothetical protein
MAPWVYNAELMQELDLTNTASLYFETRPVSKRFVEAHEIWQLLAGPAPSANEIECHKIDITHQTKKEATKKATEEARIAALSAPKPRGAKHPTAQQKPTPPARAGGGGGAEKQQVKVLTTEKRNFEKKLLNATQQLEKQQQKHQEQLQQL